MCGFRKYPYLLQGWFFCLYVSNPPPGISNFASYFRLKSLAFETPFPSDFPMTIFRWVYIFSGITPFVYCNMMQRPHCVYMYIVKMQITVVVINVLQCRYWLYIIILKACCCLWYNTGFFNFMLVSKLYQSIKCHHLLSIGIDSQFSLIGHH